MNYKHLMELVIEPTLKKIGLYSEAAANLILGTIAQESQATFLKQIGGGPALGIIQMEPFTYYDIWWNYLIYKNDIAKRIENLSSIESMTESGVPDEQQLITNLAFAVGMCRVHYLRRPEALPPADDIQALGEYWKQHYNTPLGKGTVEEFVNNYPKI